MEDEGKDERESVISFPSPTSLERFWTIGPEIPFLVKSREPWALKDPLSRRADSRVIPSSFDTSSSKRISLRAGDGEIIEWPRDERRE